MLLVEKGKGDSLGFSKPQTSYDWHPYILDVYKKRTRGEETLTVNLELEGTFKWLWPLCITDRLLLLWRQRQRGRT